MVTTWSQKLHSHRDSGLAGLNGSFPTPDTRDPMRTRELVLVFFRKTLFCQHQGRYQKYHRFFGGATTQTPELCSGVWSGRTENEIKDPERGPPTRKCHKRVRKHQKGSLLANPSKNRQKDCRLSVVSAEMKIPEKTRKPRLFCPPSLRKSTPTLLLSAPCLSGSSPMQEDRASEAAEARSGEPGPARNERQRPRRDTW